MAEASINTANKHFSANTRINLVWRFAVSGSYFYYPAFLSSNY
jgi:hypothetical protein